MVSFCRSHSNGCFPMQILTIVAVVLHVIVSLALIGLILLHSGRGGGLSDMFGGGFGPGGGSGGATLAERNLDRLTVFVGLAFSTTTISLTWLLA